MKTASVISLILLLIAGFVSIDLGLNCLALTVPELQDGIGYHSILQNTLGLLENTGIDRPADFFYAFRNSIWITFAILVENSALYIVSKIKNKTM